MTMKRYREIPIELVITVDQAKQVVELGRVIARSATLREVEQALDLVNQVDELVSQLAGRYAKALELTDKIEKRANEEIRP